MRRGTTAVVAVLVGLSAAVAGYAGTQVTRLGCVTPFCPPVEQSTAVPTAFPSSMDGVWTGIIHQDDGRKWPIELRINEGATLATVLYPELGCTGTLTFLDATAASLRAREEISSGDCTRGGAVTLAATSGGLDWTYQPDGDTYSATGRLCPSRPAVMTC